MAAAAMPFLRMAGTRLAPLLARARTSFDRAMPQTNVDRLMEFGPNVLFAASAGLMAPPGTDGMTRAGIVAEDAIGNLALDVGLRMLGGPVSRGIAQLKGKQALSDAGESAVRTGLSMTGGLGLNMAGLMPRPFMNAAYDRYEKDLSDEQQQQLALRDKMIRDQVIREMGGYATVAEPFISAGYDLGYGAPRMASGDEMSVLPLGLM